MTPFFTFRICKSFLSLLQESQGQQSLSILNKYSFPLLLSLCCRIRLFADIFPEKEHINFR